MMLVFGTSLRSIDTIMIYLFRHCAMQKAVLAISETLQEPTSVAFSVKQDWVTQPPNARSAPPNSTF
jgi:hypothetical protein